MKIIPSQTSLTTTVSSSFPSEVPVSPERDYTKVANIFTQPGSATHAGRIQSFTATVADLLGEGQYLIPQRSL